jgi:hypothetical protein
MSKEQTFRSEDMPFGIANGKSQIPKYGIWNLRSEIPSASEDSLHEKIGVPIVGTWVNRPQNEFI